MEGAYQIKTGTLYSLSEQQLVDCSAAEGNAGCNGGWMDQAFVYAETSALDSESSYPYTGVTGTTCNYDNKGLVETVGYTDVTANDPDQLKAAAALGPVSVAI